jgi:hypothetical protein
MLACSSVASAESVWVRRVRLSTRWMVATPMVGALRGLAAATGVLSPRRPAATGRVKPPCAARAASSA